MFTIGRLNRWGMVMVGLRSGPFILLDANDFPAVLAHAENEVVAQGCEAFGLEVPMVNHVAVDYLLGRGFRLDPFIAIFMSDASSSIWARLDKMDILLGIGDRNAFPVEQQLHLFRRVK